MLYRKNIQVLLIKLTSTRKDCFVPRNDEVNVMVSVSNHRKQGLRAILRQAQDDTLVPFTFRLSPSTLLKAFCFLLSAFCLTSCSLNPDMQGRGVTNLQGEWQQDSSTIQQKLVISSNYHIRFDCDSFFVQINSTSKVNYGADTCMKSGHWSEYIKGNYAQKNDTLYLKGLFCNPDYSYKENTDCFRTGPYKEFFKIVHQKDSIIQLSGTSSVIPIRLHLIKRTSCTPKPL